MREVRYAEEYVYTCPRLSAQLEASEAGIRIRDSRHQTLLQPEYLSYVVVKYLTS